MGTFLSEAAAVLLFSGAAAAYAYAGLAALGRRVAPEHAFAHRGFIVWWWGLAASTGAMAVTLLGKGGGDVRLAALQVYVVAHHVAVAGLLVHAAYLAGGDRRAALGVGATQALGLPVSLWLFVQVEDVGGRQFVLGEGLEAALPFIVTLFFGPAAVAAVAYAVAAARLPESGLRWRLAFLSLGIGGWGLANAIGWGTSRMEGVLVLRAVVTLVALAAPVAVLVAYRPPRRLAERMGLNAGPEA